jgi:hypothetical protein
MKKLKSLEEHNKEKGNAYEIINNPRLNGIACPKCGEELYDDKPNEILTTFPPQKSFKCSNINCGYKGYRIA